MRRIRLSRRVVRRAAGVAALSCFAVALFGAVAAAGGEAAAASPAVLELVETSPIETTLDHPDLREAHVVWQEMIAGARTSLDFAHFYATSEPGSRLEPIIRAVEAAAARGVRVRFLFDELFYHKEPATVDALASRPGVEVRRLDAGAHMGGVLHAKFFLVDGREAYLGSQNFDWRSLTHVQELGVRTTAPGVVAALGEVFADDWALAGGMGRPPHADRPASFGHREPVRFGEESVEVLPVLSPRGWIPEASEDDDALWDLPRLVALIDGADRHVRVQVMSYGTVDREGRYFDTLETALRRAAARGVRVHLLVADWSKRKKTIVGLQSLQILPGITVKLVTIPRWSGGFVPYARVIHAKYLVVDGRSAWIGTSNWERDYFHQSRNVGLIVEGATFAARLERFFDDLWESPYATVVDPCAAYEPPAIGKEH